MGRRSRGAFLVLFVVALVAGAFFLSRTAGRGPAARPDASLLARERSEEPAAPSLVLPEPAPLLPDAAALGREEVGATDGDAHVPDEEAAFAALGRDEGLLQIRVIAIETGHPLAGISLRLEVQRGGRRAEAVRRELVTNAQGRVDCRVPAGADCLLGTDAPARPGARPLRWSARSVPAGEIRTVVLQLFESTDLPWHALAVDAGSGAPLADARAVLVEKDPLVEPRTLLVVEAEPDGILRLDCNSSRASFVRIEAPGHATRVLAVQTGHEQRADAVRVELDLPAALAVFVHDAQGTPQTDLDLAVSCPRSALMAGAEPNPSFDGGDPTWRVRTSPAGWARVDGLPPRVVLTLTFGPEGKPVYQTVIEPGPDPGRTATLRVELGSGRTLAGVTQRPDGESCGHVALWLLPARKGERYLDYSMEERVFQRTVSDEEGRFRFDGVPAGRWFVGPEPERGLMRGGKRTLLLFGADLRVRGIAPVATEVNLKDDPVGDVRVTCWSDLFLEGEVVGLEEHPEDFREDFVLVEARGEEISLSALVDFDGAFRLGPLPPGRYELTATGAGLTSPTVAAQAGSEGLVLRLSRSPAKTR